VLPGGNNFPGLHPPAGNVRRRQRPPVPPHPLRPGTAGRRL